MTLDIISGVVASAGPTWTDVTMAGMTALSVGVAIWAVVVAKGSKDQAAAAVAAAREANTFADDANRLASESNQIAREAARDARAAPTDVAWDELLAAVAALQTLDVASSSSPEPHRPLLTAVRTRATLLVDRLDWDGFDEWLAREVRYGVMLMHEAAVVGQRSEPLTVDSVLEISHDFHLWVAAFTQNLRRFRKIGPDADALAKLTDLVVSGTAKLAARNAWPLPPDHIPGVGLLDEDE